MPGIRDLVKSRTVLIATVLIIAYWPVALLYSGPGMFELLNGVLLGIATAVIIAYTPEAIRAAVKPSPDSTDQLIMGIVLTWFATLLYRGWGIWSRATGFPEWMRYSPIAGFLLYLFILGGILHITAPNSLNDRVPTLAWIRVGLAIGFGAFAAGLVVGLRAAGPFAGP